VTTRSYARYRMGTIGTPTDSGRGTSWVLPPRRFVALQAQVGTVEATILGSEQKRR
jgi:hypothetical protein